MDLFALAGAWPVALLWVLWGSLMSALGVAVAVRSGVRRAARSFDRDPETGGHPLDGLVPNVIAVIGELFTILARAVAMVPLGWITGGALGLLVASIVEAHSGPIAAFWSRPVLTIAGVALTLVLGVLVVAWFRIRA